MKAANTSAKTGSVGAALSAGADDGVPDDVDERGYAPFEEAQQRAGEPARSTMYDWISKGLFPRPYQLGPGRVGWLRRELAAWERSRPPSSVSVKPAA